MAENNAKLYEAAFDWIPRNRNIYKNQDPDSRELLAASIWPTWNPEFKNSDGTKGSKIKPMPFDSEFWASTQHNSSAVNLTQVKGYITLLPIAWTKGEYNNIGYHTWLVTENKKKAMPDASVNQAELPVYKRPA